MKSLALVLALVFTSTVAKSAVIYEHTFGGTGTLNSVAVTTASTFAGGTSGATWSASVLYSANGSVAAGSGGALLPFTPQLNYKYTLTGTVTTASTASGWYALGFATGTNSGSNHYNNGGTAWILKHGSGSIQTYLNAQTGAEGEGTIDPLVSTSANFTITLDTSTPLWKAEWFLNGTSVRQVTYTANPDIKTIGFSNSGIAGSISNFQFSAVAVPEPSLSILALLGVFAVLAHRRRSL